MPVYRLLPFLRPHSWRMVGAIVANIVAALLDAFSVALLIPFLNTLFDQPRSAIGERAGREAALRATIGGCIDARRQDGSLRNVIFVVIIVVIAQECAGVDYRPARRDAPGVRDARSAECGLQAPRAPAARLFHAHENRADPLARDQRHVRDAADPHADRDAVAPEQRARVELHRVPVRHFVAADAHGAGDRADAQPRRCQPIVQKAAQGKSAARKPARRDDERAAGDGERHSAGEIVRAPRHIEEARFADASNRYAKQHCSTDALSRSRAAGHGGHRHC